MKKIITLLLTITLFMSLGITAFASENPTEIDVYAKVIRTIEGEYDAEIQNGAAETILDDGTSVSVTNAPNDAVALMVVPVPKTETEAWSWITSCVKKVATPVHTFNIYFVNSNGDQIAANGAVVTIRCPHCSSVPIVCSLDTDGSVHVLNTASRTRTVGVTFTTNGSAYYVMAEKTASPDPEEDHDVDIKEPTGGNVEISDKTPETGDTVTITPKPDNGKEVDKVIVKDKDGNTIPVTDNGDGTYSYKQPDGDVTIEEIFKDKNTTDTDLVKLDVPPTGDNSHVGLWLSILIMAVVMFVALFYDKKKKN